MDFWKRVDLLVISQKTTYRWLASMLSVSETTVSGWRRTNVLPRADHSLMIARALGVSVEYLVNGESSPITDYPIEQQPFNDGFNSRIKYILKDLAVLSIAQLDMVAIQVKALADSARANDKSKQA